MKGTELLKAVVKQYIGTDHITEDEFAQIGRAITRSFRNLYKAYHAKEPGYTAKDHSERVTEIVFDWENYEVRIKRQEREFKLTQLQFLKFLNLIEICYGKVLPLGSVIKLDLDLIPEELRKSYHASSASSMFMISGRKSPIRGSFGEYYVDYVARMYPFGESEYMQPFLISSMMIKSVVFEGMKNELEEKFVDTVLREELVYKNSRSIGFLLDDEVEQLEQEMYAHEEVIEDGDGSISSGTA